MAIALPVIFLICEALMAVNMAYFGANQPVSELWHVHCFGIGVGGFARTFDRTNLAKFYRQTFNVR